MNAFLLAAAALPPLIYSNTPVAAAGKSTALHASCGSVTEGGNAACTVSKSGGNGKALTVTWAAGSANGQVVLTSTAPVAVSVPIPDDAIVNGTRTVSFVASYGTISAIAAITVLDNDVPPPPPAVTWTKCADEGGTCSVSGTANVRYGAASRWVQKSISGSVACNNSVFGDPVVGTVKECDTDGVVASPPPPSTQTCPDGSVVLNGAPCPLPPPAPTTLQKGGYAKATTSCPGVYGDGGGGPGVMVGPTYKVIAWGWPLNAMPYSTNGANAWTVEDPSGGPAITVWASCLAPVAAP